MDEPCVDVKGSRAVVSHMPQTDPLQQRAVRGYYPLYKVRTKPERAEFRTRIMPPHWNSGIFQVRYSSLEIN